MSNESQVSTEDNSGPNIWKIIAVILGTLILFVLVLFVVRALVGDSGVTGPEVVPPPPDTSGPYLVTNTDVNVRSGPGTNYPSYGVAPKGTTFVATGISQDGGWYQVQIPIQFVDSGLGWVSADWVQASNTENLPVVEPPAP
jgi:uncharacterized protein YgiM (DUF1202 family)